MNIATSKISESVSWSSEASMIRGILLEIEYRDVTRIQNEDEYAVTWIEMCAK